MRTANNHGFGKITAVMGRWRKSKARRIVALKGILPDTTSLVRILEDGGIEVEYDRTMVDAFVDNFKDAWAHRDWLKQQRIPFEQEFESWP